MGEVKYFGKEVSATTSYTKALTAAANSASSSTSILEKSMNRASAAAKYFRDSNGRLRDSLGRFAAGSSQAASTLSNLSGKAHEAQAAISGAGNAAVVAGGNFRGMTTTLTAIAGAYAAAQGAAKIFKATVGEAAKTEMEKITISALFNDTKKADRWFKYIEDRAADSPLFSMDDMLKTSKSFIPLFKDENQLKKMTALTERLAASNPLQGMEGSAFAIREALSGDMVSLQERFNLPKKMLKDLKGKEGAAFIAEMDRILVKLGYTDKFMADLGNSGIAKYNQAVEKMRISLKNMGVEGLEASKGALDRINKMFDEGRFKGLEKAGSSIIASIMRGIESGVVSLDKFILKLQNDPAWNKLSFSEKITKALDIGTESAKNWLENGGSAKIASVAGKLAETGAAVGFAIAGGIAKGVGNYLLENPMAAAVVAFVGASRIPGVGAAAAAGAAIAAALISAVDMAVNKALASIEKTKQAIYNLETTDYGKAMNRVLEHEKKIKSGAVPKGTPVFSGKTTMKAYEPSLWQKIKSNLPGFATGLERVPYDDMVVRVHKDETILNANQAEQYRKYGLAMSYNSLMNNSGSKGKGDIKVDVGGINVTIQGENKHPKKLADELTIYIAENLVREIKMAGMNM